MAKLVTSKVRFSYVTVFSPKAMEEGGKEKYSVCILIPKSDTKAVNAIKQAIEDAKLEGKSSKFEGKIPKNLKIPLRDGDLDRDTEEYENHWFINATSHTKPKVVETNPSIEIIDPDEFYSGCYGRASVNFYPYNHGVSKGIACGLNFLQKLEDGEPLAGKGSAEEDFAEAYDPLMD